MMSLFGSGFEFLVFLEGRVGNSFDRAEIVAGGWLWEDLFLVLNLKVRTSALIVKWHELQSTLSRVLILSSLTDKFA